MVRISINEHLNRLQVLENEKPLNVRRSVPSIARLAKISNIPRATLYNLVGDKYESIRFDHLSAILNALRSEGFDVTIADLLTEHPVSTLPNESA